MKKEVIKFNGYVPIDDEERYVIMTGLNLLIEDSYTEPAALYTIKNIYNKLNINSHKLENRLKKLEIQDIFEGV